MKKILLLSLAVLSPQIFAASVELECSEDLFGMKNFFHLTEERGNGYGKKVIRYAFRIAENGEARNFYAQELNAIWNDTYISLSRNYDRDFTAKIDRETLVYSEGGTWLSDPNSTKFELECQITSNITAKAKRWKKEADDYEKAQTEAKKAKNLI